MRAALAPLPDDINDDAFILLYQSKQVILASK